MSYDPYHHRRSSRLRGYDYSQAGAYFVTIVCHNRQALFGEVTNDAMQLNSYGHVVKEEWLLTPEVRPYVTLDAYVIIPNHLHGILIICDHDIAGAGGASRAEVDVIPIAVGACRGHGPTSRADATSTTRHPTAPKSGSLGAIVAQFKSRCTKRINRLRGTPSAPIWQRNYHDRIIRDMFELDRIRSYIETNPARWESDP